MEVSGTQMIVGLILGIAFLIFLVLKTKIHAFIALIIAASITGIVGGMDPNEVVAEITNGFGSTLGSIGIIIGLGVMMGRILEVSGAAEKLAYTLIKKLGEKKEEWAMAVAGYVVAIPIFVDSAFVILHPLVKALSRKTGKSVVALGVALAVGLAVTHHAVPPTPGPLGVAGIFGADVGLMILVGLVFSIPIIIVGVLYAKWIGKKIHQVPAEDGEGYVRLEEGAVYQEFLEAVDEREKELPSFTKAIMPILIPIILIFINTTFGALHDSGVLTLNETVLSYIKFIGNPVIAVGLGLIVAIYTLTNNLRKAETLDRMEEGIKTAGIILLVTGAGGALGNVLRASGTGDLIAEQVAMWSIPAILIPFFISTFVRLVQGSGTVAMITAASISAPIVASLDVNLVLAAQAAALGAMIFSYFNDSLFWVVNRMLGIKNVKEQILVWSVPTTLAWFVALIMLLVSDFLVRLF
ncbi:GntP family permease [Ornithinibacillus halophilus]|uniref:Gluconate:H+ symporter, GntP family n=1 Tax=Ornithinibacillus halophilus TaxID=930117 RepID=A0A1M5IDI8_9BACI|nr:gluconate:H+ symporter [Ornithinibacillus halophilus]SHG26332.1 gluconate:H+ symporter, GntP family [Ornithinibacillus halophilus]